MGHQEADIFRHSEIQRFIKTFWISTFEHWPCADTLPRSGRSTFSKQLNCRHFHSKNDVFTYLYIYIYIQRSHYWSINIACILSKEVGKSNLGQYGEMKSRDGKSQAAERREHHYPFLFIILLPYPVSSCTPFLILYHPFSFTPPFPSSTILYHNFLKQPPFLPLSLYLNHPF